MGNYINKNLMKDEYVVYETTYHWTHYLSIISLFTLGLWPYIQSNTDEFVVTNRRIVIKKGLFAYYTLVMNLSRVESVHIEQSIIGRILSYGCITIVGSGGTRERFIHIANPIHFRQSFIEIS
jgi:uncharacterized membrane protein YdbT with pleckstrin-like domain